MILLKPSNFAPHIRKMKTMFPILLLGFSCPNSSSVDYSMMTFEVHTIFDFSIEEYADKFDGDLFPITIILEEYDPESEFRGTVNISMIGFLSITRNCTGKFDCFAAEVDPSFMWKVDSIHFVPVDYVYFSDLIINNSEMKGKFAPSGPGLDIFLIEFIASRKE